MRPLACRRTAATVAVAAGLSGGLISALAPAATATPGVARAALSAAVPVSSDWFVDPRTPAERRAQIAVPRDPNGHVGKVRETRAAYRTHAGDLAVPVRFGFGHALDEGQAVTLNTKGQSFRNDGELSARGREQLSGLAHALADASSIRCEGYADYAGPSRSSHRLARHQASAVCGALAADLHVEHTTVSYGPTHPAVVGGNPGDRQFNGRVVVAMTGARPATPVFEVPSAPTGVHATVDGATVTVSFTPPASDGGAPVTGYEVRADNGDWSPVTLSSNGVSFRLTGQAPGTHLYEVRAVNVVGASAASSQAAAEVVAEVVSVQPDAPTISYFGYNGISRAWVVSFTAGADNGATVTGWQAAAGDGPWTDLVSDPTSPQHVSLSCEIGACGWSYGTPVRLRAVTATGFSPASQPYVHNDMF